MHSMTCYATSDAQQRAQLLVMNGFGTLLSSLKVLNVADVHNYVNIQRIFIINVISKESKLYSHFQ